MNESTPFENAPQSVQEIRELGRGRAAIARLVDATFADGTTIRCVEKVFAPGLLTRVIYRVSFFAPFAYQFNKDAIAACYFRRRVAARVLQQAKVDVSVAKPLYIRFDSSAPGWVLAAEHIDGRGIRPASPTSSVSEIDEILDSMRRAKQAFLDAGLTGSGWQIDPRAMVSTANLLRRGNRYTIVDLESGIPAVLVPQYLRLAAATGSVPPFDDLNDQVLSSTSLDSCDDVAALIHHTSLWKQSEPSPLRIGTWQRIGRSLWRRVRRSTGSVWRLFTQRRYQTFVGRTHLRRSVRRWQREQRIDHDLAGCLLQHLNGAEVTTYARGLALHLAAKSFSPLVVPAKFGGIAAAIATGNLWFLLPWLILPMMRTLITLLSWLGTGRRIRHAEALWVGLIPTLGSLAFPIQLCAKQPELSRFLVRDFASQVGRHVPIYGGKDSRTEIALIEWTDRFVSLIGRRATPTHEQQSIIVPTEARESHLALQIAAPNRPSD